jgi:hypothetical protein
VHPRVRRIIAGAGAACLTVSAFCFASETALRAAPLLAVRLRLPFTTPQIALDVPAPSPSPSASSRPHRGFLGNGPIVFKGTGTYQLGIQRSSRNGLFQGAENYSSGLSMVAERRTEQTAFSVSSAFGYGSGGFNTGSLIVGYRTPKFGLTYGQVTGPSDSQLGIGGFARGLSLSLPSRTGDVSYFVSSAQQADQTTFRIYGTRRTWNALGGFVSAAGYYGRGEQGTGRQTIVDLGYRRYGAALSTQTEIAASTNHDVTGAPNGTQLATAFHADLQGKTTFATLGVRYAPTGFQTLTGGTSGGLNVDLALRRHSDRLGDVAVDFGHADQRVNDEVQHDNRATFSGGKSWNNVAVQYVAGLEGTQGGGGTTLQRTGAISLSESIKNWTLSETLQSSSVSGPSGTALQSQLALGASRPLFGGSVAYQFTRNISSGGEGGAVGTSVSQALSYRRAIGRKLDVGIAEAVQMTANGGVPARVYQTDIQLVRKISNVVALQATANFTHQSGPGGGSGHGFNISLIGPFGFGQPRSDYGRANPNLPAVIRGIVTYSATANPFAYNAPAQRGYNNVVVILDGHVSQRTDANGEFEFRFVPQGTHTIRIDTATLGPGLIADHDYQSLRVLGGQTTTVQFAVGNFAGVSGVVATTDAAGVKHGIGNVGIAIDGIQAATTAADGHYAVGRLNPGAHTVELVEASIPSTVAFIGDRKRTVTVTPGSSVPLNFAATPLGSITGSVMVPADGGFGTLIGLKNVYVVAEPGERAVITDDAGAFILDNMPPGTYTLTVDPDTLPDGLSVLSGPDGPLALSGGATLSGVVFKLGAGAKQVVYTFSDGKRTPIQLLTDPAVAPPGAMLRITARTAAKDVKSLVVESDVFGSFPLRYDARLGAWLGLVMVPSLAKGDYALTATAHRKDVTDAAALVPIDPQIPLFTIRMSPQRPQGGHTVRVMLKTLAAVEEADTLLFEDGYKLLLPKPSGRVFTFDMRLWQKGLPYSATLVTKRGQNYPISLR